MKSPFFSVIIPTRNRTDYIGRAVDAVLDQTFENLELIVVDDGSTDNTRELIEQRSEDERLRYYRTVQMGANVARNVGIALSRADWIAFLDSDDLWERKRLETVATAIQKSEDLHWYITDCRRINAQQTAIREDFIHSEYLDQYLLSFGSLGGTINLIAPRQFLNEIDGFDTQLSSCQDIDMFYRLQEKFPLEYLPGVFAIYDLKSNQRITSRENQKLHGLEAFYSKYRGQMSFLSRCLAKKKIFVFAWRFRRWGIILKTLPFALLIKGLKMMHGVGEDRDLFFETGFWLDILQKR